MNAQMNNDYNDNAGSVNS